MENVHRCDGTEMMGGKDMSGGQQETEVHSLLYI